MIENQKNNDVNLFRFLSIKGSEILSSLESLNQEIWQKDKMSELGEADTPILTLMTLSLHCCSLYTVNLILQKHQEICLKNHSKTYGSLFNQVISSFRPHFSNETITDTITYCNENIKYFKNNPILFPTSNKFIQCTTDKLISIFQNNKCITNTKNTNNESTAHILLKDDYYFYSPEHIHEKLNSLKKIINLKEIDKDGNTLLHICTYNTACKSPTIEFLITSGVDLKSRNNFGYNALESAIKYNRIDLVEHFLEYHHSEFDLSNILNLGLTIYDLASCYSGELMFNLLKFYSLKIDTSIHDLSTLGAHPLHFAGLCGNNIAAELLMNQHAIAANVKDYSGATLWHWASFAGHFNIIDNNVHNDLFDKNILDNFQRSILHYAVMLGKIGYSGYKYRLIYDPNEQPKTLEIGIKLNEQNRIICQTTNYTHPTELPEIGDYGIQNINYPMLKTALEERKDFALTSLNKKEIFDYAINKDYINSQAEALEYLIYELGLNISQTDIYGWSPLYLAVLFNQTAYVDYILRQNSVVKPDIFNNDIYILAFLNCNIEIERLLFTHNVSFRQQPEKHHPLVMQVNSLEEVCANKQNLIQQLIPSALLFIDTIKDPENTAEKIFSHMNNNIIDGNLENDICAKIKHLPNPLPYDYLSDKNTLISFDKNACGYFASVLELSPIGINKAYYCNYTTYNSVVNMPSEIIGELSNMTNLREGIKEYYQNIKEALSDPTYGPLFGGAATAIVWYVTSLFPDANKYALEKTTSGLKFIGGVSIPTFITCLKPVQNLFSGWQKDYDIIESYMGTGQKEATKRLADSYKAHSYKWVYMAQAPGKCLDSKEQTNAYTDKNGVDWLLCYKEESRPIKYVETLTYKDSWSQHYYPYMATAAAVGAGIGTALLTANPFTAYKVGLITGIAWGAYDLTKEFTPKHHVINYQQLEANKYIHDHQDKNLYMVQAPSICNEGDHSYSFADENGTIRWSVCEVVGESDSSCSNSVDI